MKKARGIVCAFLLGAWVAPFSAAKVYVRWTHSVVPPVRVLGVDDLVIAWNDQAERLTAAATKLGYRVYLETTAAQAAEAAESGARLGATGIILKAETLKPAEAEESAQKLRATHPKLKILVLNAGGKQPEMRGWLVFKKDGILQVSSPTSQPWLDSNLALARYEEGFQKRQAPLYTFSWDLTDALLKEQGPHPADYALAVAEAGAFHADLLLEVHEQQQKGLATGDKGTLADWTLVRHTMAFYQQASPSTAALTAPVAVLTEDYESPYEALNLMARHNIPYRVLHSAEVKPRDLQGCDVVIAFAELGRELSDAIAAFAERGGVVVLVKLKGPYPWESSAPAKADGPSVTFTVGKGRVIELREAVTDPETFAQDVRRLMVKERIPVSLWNSLTTLVAAYRGRESGETVVELVNYAQESTQVQVQVKGRFASVRYESPEKSCCEILKPSVVDGFTEFVVPNVVIGGRVLLGTAAPAPKK